MGEVTRVVVTDVEISFGKMVKLILTFVFASIPAAIIVFSISVFAVGIASGIFSPDAGAPGAPQSSPIEPDEDWDEPDEDWDKGWVDGLSKNLSLPAPQIQDWEYSEG